MVTRDLRSYLRSQKNKKKSQTGTSKLVKTTGTVTAANASAVNAKLESFDQKKGRRQPLYNTSIPSRVIEEVRKYAYSNRT